MYEIEQAYQFEAGHVLKHHNGRCSSPHGHSYTLFVKLRSKELTKEGPKTNMIVDFYDIDKVVMPMIDQYFDHKWLNDTLQTDSPTVEFIAKWVFKHLKPHFPSLHCVTIHETANSKGSYFET